MRKFLITQNQTKQLITEIKSAKYGDVTAIYEKFAAANNCNSQTLRNAVSRFNGSSNFKRHKPLHTRNNVSQLSSWINELKLEKVGDENV